jgi:hypothetical protein
MPENVALLPLRPGLERVLDVSVVAQAELSFFCGWTAEEERGRATEAGPGSGDENAMQMRSA